MQTELNELITVLEEQRDQQAALVALSERKTQAIAGSRPEELHGIVEQERAVLGLLKAVERRQDQCVLKLAAAMAVPAEDVRMSLVIERAGEPHKERLIKLREELSGLIERQLKYNEVNMKLLQMNLEYVQFLINASAGRQGGATYGQEGGLKSAGGGARKLLDRKV